MAIDISIIYNLLVPLMTRNGVLFMAIMQVFGYFPRVLFWRKPKIKNINVDKQTFCKIVKTIHILYTKTMENYYTIYIYDT